MPEGTILSTFTWEQAQVEYNVIYFRVNRISLSQWACQNSKVLWAGSAPSSISALTFWHHMGDVLSESFPFLALRFWNSLPGDVRQIPSLASFRKHCNAELFKPGFCESWVLFSLYFLIFPDYGFCGFFLYNCLIAWSAGKANIWPDSAVFLYVYTFFKKIQHA